MPVYDGEWTVVAYCQGPSLKVLISPVPSGFSVVRITFKLQMLFFLVSLLKSVLAFISDFCC